MGFTVSRNGAGANNAEFEAYARLLHQQGLDLGKLPRVPDPGTGRRWLYLWESREKAQSFADLLKKRRTLMVGMSSKQLRSHRKDRWDPLLFRLAGDPAAWSSGSTP